MAMRYEEIRLLDHGFVRLDGQMADDLSVANSARVSLDVRHEILMQEDDPLINFLMREKHGTPFEHNAFRFHVKLPIFVAREWQRHRIASYNELSGRYKKFEDPDFYFPSREDMRTQVGKPGAYSFEKWEGGYEKIQALTVRHYQDSLELYEYMIEQGIAKEIARIVIPTALYTQMYWTINARSLMNFLELRNATQAMLEIRKFAAVVEEIFAEHMPITHKHFVNNGRMAP